MSTSDQVRAILGGTIQAYRNDPAYRQRPDVHNELERIGYRLNQPIRIALAGSLKAGKSTLVNALVGEDIAPTDATEATRIVTWFRNGPTPKVTANHRGGRRSNVPIARNGGLTFDFGDLDPGHIVAVTGRVETYLAAPRARGWGAARGRRGVSPPHLERGGHRTAQTDRR